MADIKSNTNKSIIEKTPDGTIEVKITIPWTIIEKEWELVVSEMVKNVDLAGFRKGKAPKKLVEEKLDKIRVREEVLRKLLPKAYLEGVKEHGIKPIMDPRIHIDGELLDNKDWQFHAVTCEAPSVNLNGYKEAIKKITGKSKIIVPGKAMPAGLRLRGSDSRSRQEPEAPKLDEIIKALLESAKLTIPQVLTQREADRLLSQTLDEIKKLGMSLDQYLSSTNRTADTLRAEYARKAENDLKLEFALQKVAETEKIIVDDSEIQKTIDNAKPEEKEGLKANKYLLASIIRQQKTLDFLKSL